MNRSDIHDLAVAAGNAYHNTPPDRATVLRDSLSQNRGFMYANAECVTVAIRGTYSLEDAKTDAEIVQEHEEGGLVHWGFWHEYQTLKYQVDAFIKANPGKMIRVCGHSLGGAIATFIAEQAYLDAREPAVIQLLTLGSPRVGNKAFADHFNRLKIDSLRVVHRYDLIPRVPKLDYWHVDELLHLDDTGGEMKLGWMGVVYGWLTQKSLADHHVMGYLCALELYLKGMTS